MHLLNLDSNLLLFGRETVIFIHCGNGCNISNYSVPEHHSSSTTMYTNRSSRFFQLFNDIERLYSHIARVSSSCGQSVFFINTTCIKMSRRSMRVGPQSTFVYMYTQVVVREEQCSEMIQIEISYRENHRQFVLI